MSQVNLPSSTGLPSSEMKYNLDFSMPPESKSYSIRIPASNVSQITTTLVQILLHQRIGAIWLCRVQILFLTSPVVHLLHCF